MMLISSIALAQAAKPKTAAKKLSVPEQIQKIIKKRNEEQSKKIRELDRELRKIGTQINEAISKSDSKKSFDKINKKRLEEKKRLQLEKVEARQKQIQEIKEKYDEYFKKVKKNLPQKGKYKDYTEYNRQLTRPVRK